MAVGDAKAGVVENSQQAYQVCSSTGSSFLTSFSSGWSISYLNDYYYLRFFPLTLGMKLDLTIPWLVFPLFWVSRIKGTSVSCKITAKNVKYHMQKHLVNLNWETKLENFFPQKWRSWSGWCFFFVKTSVADPWYFETDPDPWIHSLILRIRLPDPDKCLAYYLLYALHQSSKKDNNFLRSHKPVESKVYL